MEPSTLLPVAATRPDARPLARAAVPQGGDLDRPTLRTPMAVPEVDLAFADILDLFNPLQHIPIVSSIYRAVTGDEISGPATVLGGALFGGPLGFVAGIVEAISSQIAGESLGEMAIAAAFGGVEQGHGQGQTTAVAAADPADARPTPSRVAAQAPEPEIRAAPAAFHTAAKSTEMPAKLKPVPVIPVSEQPLTGDAALQALAADLRGPGVSAAVLQPPSMAPRIGTTETDARLMTPLPPDEFAAQMLEGLDKYKALAAERAQQQAAPTRRIDQAL